MPVYLPPPAHAGRGPDGQGWNRLSLNAHMGTAAARCALRPRTYATLVESQDTRRAAWNGDYDVCTGEGRCDDCPIYQAAPTKIRPRSPRVLIRYGLSDGLCHQMVHPDPVNGLEGWSWWWTWDQIACLEDGWKIGPRADDEHSKAFWLIRIAVDEP